MHALPGLPPLPPYIPYLSCYFIWIFVFYQLALQLTAFGHLKVANTFSPGPFWPFRHRNAIGEKNTAINCRLN